MLPLQVLWFLLTPALLVVVHHVHADSVPPPAPRRDDCPSKCGNVSIPYPFGTVGCAWPGQDNFTITCSDDDLSPPRPYLFNLEIINISLEHSQITVYTRAVSSICYSSFNTTQRQPPEEHDWLIRSTGSPMLISPAANEFTAVGCSGLALLQGWRNRSYLTGCVTTCTSLDDVAQDGDECTGIGCCQTHIPGNLSGVEFYWGSGNYTPVNLVWSVSSCNYAFLSAKGWYNFKRQDLYSSSTSFGSRAAVRIPLVLDWAIRKDGTCQGVGPAPTAPACVSGNSYCVNAKYGLGYTCNCSQGYAGNPYLTGDDGCTNIDECQLRKSNPSVYEELYPCSSGSTCYDTRGSYECKCNFGLRGDGKPPKKCKRIVPPIALEALAIYIVIVLVCLLIKEYKQRKKTVLFDKNGGEILEGMDIKIFTEEQLEKITNRYSEPIGEGAFGKVFRGTIDDGTLVAVKRSVAKGEALPKEEFVNEITTQLRLKHDNLVRLVGCCLETDIPMLVYEYIPKGSLYNALHGDGSVMLSLPVRLDIAIGAAEALAYMHSQDGHSIVHGDVKSGNILLGDDFAPKVSDFGSSKLVSTSRDANWAVVGDMSYIDPVYTKTGRFTEKSDVYSFGVVLLELITGKTARYDTNNSLPLNFVKSYREEEARRKMYADWRVLCADDDDAQHLQQQPHSCVECLDRIGALAVQCLIMEGVDERPTMAEVVQELKKVKSNNSLCDC